MGLRLHERSWRIRPELLLCAAAALLSPGLLHAQSVPDAGSVLKQIEQERRAPLPMQQPHPEVVKISTVCAPNTGPATIVKPMNASMCVRL